MIQFLSINRDYRYPPVALLVYRFFTSRETQIILDQKTGHHPYIRRLLGNAISNDETRLNQTHIRTKFHCKYISIPL